MFLINGLVAGWIFTLTQGVDTIPGLIGTAGTTSNAGNDTIIAGEGSAGGVHTLGASDLINGGTGTDMIDIKSIDHALTPRISNVEKMYVQALGTGADAVNMVNATDVQELWSNNSTANLAVTNLQEKATIGVKGGNGSNFTVQAAAAALTGDLAIALDTANAGNLFVNATGAAGGAGYTSTTINAATGSNAITGAAGTGANVIGTLDVGNALATVKVTGDGAVRVTNDLAATVRTIDASANKGGANFNITNNTGNVTFTGGEGADRVNFGGTLNLNDKVDGGAARDILGVTNQASIITGLQVSNVEILELNTLNGTLEAGRIAGVDEVRVTTTLDNVSGTAIVNGLTSNSTFVTNDSGDVRLNITNAQVAGTNDTLNLKTGIAGAGGLDVMAGGVENVAYTQNNVANAGAVTRLNFYDTDGQVDMTNLTIANNAGNTTRADWLVNTIKTVDASASKGSVVISVNNGNPTNGVNITGGEGSDTLLGGDGKDIIVGGAGNDNVSGDSFWVIPGTGGAAIPQQSTITIANAEVGDVFNINGTNVVWTGVEATDNAAVIAAAATAGVTITADVAGVANAGTFTLVGPNTGVAFAEPVVSATNVAAAAEVSTVTVDNANVYDAGDVVTVTIDGTNYSVTATAGQTAAQIATLLAAQVNGGAAMTAVAGGAGGNELTLTGVNATTNYAVSASIVDIPAATQQPQITNVVLGSPTAVDAGDIFRVNVDGTIYAGTAGAVATPGTLAAALAAGLPAGYTVTENGAGTIAIQGLANGTPFIVASAGTTNQTSASDTVTIDFTTTANWDAGDSYTIDIDTVTVATGALAADGAAAATANAFATAFYASTLPATGYTLTNVAGVVTVTGPAGANIALTNEATVQDPANAQVDAVTFTDTDWTNNGTAGVLAVRVTVGATTQTFQATVAAATEAGGEAAVTNIVNQINVAGLGVTAAAANGGAANNLAGLTLTADTAGTPFTAVALESGAAATSPTPAVTNTTPNDTVNPNAVPYATDNNTSVTVGNADEIITITPVQPGVATTTATNAAPAVVDNTFTPAGADTQTIAATTVVGQASGDQYVTAAATADTLTGGAGNDSFWFLSGSNGWNGTAFTTMDTITELNLGGATAILGVDKIVLNRATFNAFANTDLINAGTELAMTGPNLGAAVQALFNAGGALNGSVNDVGLFSYGSDKYLIVTDNVAGNNGGDVIIKVTGVTGTLDLSDIVLV